MNERGGFSIYAWAGIAGRARRVWRIGVICACRALRGLSIGVGRVALWRGFRREKQPELAVPLFFLLGSMIAWGQNTYAARTCHLGARSLGFSFLLISSPPFVLAAFPSCLTFISLGMRLCCHGFFSRY